SAPNFASQTWTALASTAWKTGSSSVGELLMTCNTSDVALCCSRASASSRVKRSSCSCISAAEGPRPRGAVDSLRRLSFVALRWRIFHMRRSSLPRPTTDAIDVRRADASHGAPPTTFRITPEAPKLYHLHAEIERGLDRGWRTRAQCAVLRPRMT